MGSRRSIHVVLAAFALLLVAATASLTRLTPPTFGQTEEIPAQQHEFFEDVYGHLPGHVCELPYVPLREGAMLPESVPFSAEKLATLPRTASIQVNYIGNWSNEARTAFQYAVDIWERYVTSSVPIIVDAEWSALAENTLGAAGPQTYVRGFDAAPNASTWYPIALANSLAGFDLSDSNDISAFFNSDFDWYLGTDASPEFDEIDFVSVVLHELGHGLGFAGSMRTNGATANWGLNSGYPLAYDRFTENGGGTSLISGFANNSNALYRQVTSGSVFFDGVQTRLANGGSPAQLYAPSVWNQGSSYSHLDDSFNGSNNALMTFSITPGVAIHVPGAVTLGVFTDMGWQTEQGLSIEDTSIMLEQNTTTDNAVDLWALADDGQYADSQLTFSLFGSTSNAAIDVTLSGNRYLDIETSGIGELSLVVRVTNPDLQTETATITINSVATVNSQYLPVVTR